MRQFLSTTMLTCSRGVWSGQPLKVYVKHKNADKKQLHLSLLEPLECEKMDPEDRVPMDTFELDQQVWGQVCCVCCVCCVRYGLLCGMVVSVIGECGGGSV